jgi:Holliday junction DNA helicase RuvB
MLEELRANAARLIAANPEVRRIVARALEVEVEGRRLQEEGARQWNVPVGEYLGWEWHAIPCPPARLRNLVEEGVLKVGYQSRSTTNYLVVDPDVARELLATVEDGLELGEIPDGLFDHIVGHEEAKYWLTKSLRSDQPVHILLAGPPATAKSLFLEAVGSLPGAQFALGGATSKAGVADFLINFRPRYLIIDELDKMSAQDFSVLLSLMQSGTVARLKKGMRSHEQMTTWVFAGVNRKDRLPPELLSRFVQFDFKEYTIAEFLEVAGSVLIQMGKPLDLARYIAMKVSLRTRDVRQAIQVAKLCDTDEEVDRFEDKRR